MNSSLSKIANTNRFKNLTASVILIGSLTATSLLHAHKFLSEIITEANLGANAVFITVATFHLTQEDMTTLEQANQPIDYFVESIQGYDGQPKVAIRSRQREVEESCEASQSKTCGQFDHFTRGRAAALNTCYDLYQAEPEAYPTELVPMYLGPATFVDVDTASDEHHLNYHLSQGLTFSCGYVTWVLKDKTKESRYSY